MTDYDRWVRQNTYVWADLHPAVAGSVSGQRNMADLPGILDPLDRTKVCGCHPAGERWWLCPFHTGMQYGVGLRLPEG